MRRNVSPAKGLLSLAPSGGLRYGCSKEGDVLEASQGVVEMGARGGSEELGAVVHRPAGRRGRGSPKHCRCTGLPVLRRTAGRSIRSGRPASRWALAAACGHSHHGRTCGVALASMKIIDVGVDDGLQLRTHG